MKVACPRSIESTYTQYDMLAPTHCQEFEAIVHSPAGGQFANRFIRLALGLKRRGWCHYSAKALVERLRWHEQVKAGPGAEPFKFNNNHTAYLARFAMNRCTELRGFFRLRETGRCASTIKCAIRGLHAHIETLTQIEQQ